MEIKSERSDLRGPEVEEEHGSNSAAAERAASLSLTRRICNLNVGANEPHAKRATNSSNHEEKTTTKVVNENKDPDERQGSLDHAKDTGGEEASACTGDADALKDGRAVVVDGIDSGAWRYTLGPRI
jgi:hypothetical protein